MKKRSLDLILAIMLVFVMLLSGGLTEAYLAPDYSNPDFAPTGATPFVIGPGVLPDYLTAPNWAFSPLLNKFVDPLPGLCVPSAANSFCAGSDPDPMKNKNIPVALPDIVTYPGSDYYVIELRQYSEMMHTGLVNPTTLRGYVQANNGTDTVSNGGCADPSIDPTNAAGLNCTSADNTLAPAVQHFLGPVIVATKGRPVRVLFRNLIDPFVNGNLFLPVDDTIMGSGAYDINYNPQTMAMNPIDGGTGLPRVDSGMFSTNRATLHLHGGRSPWISDGTPHQWITPDIGGGVPEDTVYPQGVSVQNVPDMPTPAVGEQTFYWTNQQSSRFMFYHDHAWGITRLNVYAGEAAGYIIRDNVEQGLIDTGVIPAAEIPLVIMDKTFVDEATIAATDPTWNWGTGAVTTPGAVTWITVTNGGSGYTAIPDVVITDAGAGAGATAEAVLSTVVSSITLAAPNFGGANYVAPIVVIDSPTLDPNGIPATADAIIDGAGVITGFTITNGGSGYDPGTPPAVTIFDMNNDHIPAETATATASTSSIVTAVAVTGAGSGYTDATVAITPATGDVTGGGALATATVYDIRAPKTGDLWWPHVYMPAQNPFDVTGVAPMGRWAYGPYFYPATNNLFQPIPNPYYSPLCDPLTATIDTPGFVDGFCQAPEIPSTPNPSWGAEAFMDTPLVNGTAYPYLNLEPKHYRLRILNASHDRFMNLSLVIADPSAPTEVKMIEAAAPLPAGCPATWPPDGRAGGIPDCSTASNLLGPNWIMIGSEGGFLPMPVVIPPQVVTWNVNPSMFNVGNINGGSLILGPAERADVIVDFSDPKYHGKSLILYNDGAAPWPALNPQYDFYTNNPDGRPSGAADTTLAGKGPNTRTIMQINICTPGAGCEAAPAAFDLARLQDAFDPTTQNGENGPGVFRQAQDPIIAAQGNMNPNADPLYYETYLESQDFSAYSRAYGAVGGAQAVFPTTYPNWGISRINDSIIKFKTLDDTGALLPTVQSIAMKRKSIHDEMGATFDDYGRMRAALGLERNFGGALQVNFIVQTYSSPVTEDLLPDGIQVWKITHNGVDTHPIHFHLFDVQVLNRVGWDGFIRLPDPTEMGWKETVRISPLEDTIVAIKPVQPTLPFGLPTSYRPLNPATIIGSTVELTQIDPVTGNPRVTTNDFKDFAWEYVWHCHILSHEENDMMRSMALHVVEAVPAAPTWGTAIADPAVPKVDLAWTDNSTTEFKFTINKSDNGGAFAPLADVPANTTTYTDLAIVLGHTYTYTVTAVGASGQNTSAPISASVGLPLPPSGLTATPVNPIRIDLAWTDNSSDEGNFEVQRVTGNCASPSFATIATLAANTVAYQDNGVNPQITYSYRVRATNGFGASAWSNCVTAATPALEAPSVLNVTGTTATSISLGWTDNSTVETSFTLQRKAGNVCDNNGWTTAGAPAANATSFTNTGLTPVTEYTYRIRANAGAYTSAWSNCATGTTAAAAAVPIAPTWGTATAISAASISLVWNDNSLDETSFTLQRKTGAVCDNAGWLTINSPAADATTFQDNNRVANTQYSYRIRANNASGSSAWSGCATATTFTAATALPADPTGLIATPGAPGSGQILLSWTDNQGNTVAASETRFQPEKVTGTCPVTGWTTIASTPTNVTTTTATGFTAGNVRSFRVRAQNAFGFSGYSNCVTAVAP